MLQILRSYKTPLEEESFLQYFKMFIQPAEMESSLLTAQMYLTANK